MRAHIFIETILMTFAAAICMAVATPVFAQEVEFADSVLVEEVDTLNPDPEWYVVPLTRDSVRAGKRALVAAAACTIDSVQTFNVDSELESVSIYEYGDTTRTMTWTINSDGSRFGTGRNESGTNGDITFSATYEWDFSTNDWKGTAKEEHTFTGSNETLRTLYDWVNGAWSAHTQYTWTYENGRETEYTTYERNAAGQLAYSKQRIREYNAAGKTTLDINYTAHNGTDWSAGTKRIYEYDGNNTTLNEYYSAYTNGVWVGSSREVWTYTSGKKTYYEKDTWSNDAWVGSSKEIWEFNTAGKQTYYEKDTWSNGAWVGSSKEIWEFNGPSSTQTLHEKYGWSAGAWAISLQENSGYDAAGNNNSVENYSYTNGVQKGAKKEEYTFNAAKKKTLTIRYKWVAASGAWDYNTKLVNDFDAAGNTTEVANYTWKNGEWAGTGTRTLTTYNSNKKATEVITQSWPANATDWVNSTRKTTEYSGSKTTQEASYAWSTDINDWVGTSRSDWHYNAKGQNDTIKTYTYEGTDWIYSDRTVNTYNAAGTEIMVHNAHWDGDLSKWVMTSMTRVDILDHTAGGIRQTLNASWKCNADSVWIGMSKDSVVYTASGEMLYKLHCESWANNDWMPKYKIEFEYDDEGRVLMQQQMDWVSNDWKGYYRYEWLYDEYGNQTTYASYSGWNTTTNNWIGINKTVYIYENGQVKEYVRYNWNNGWTPSRKYSYIYDDHSRTIQYVIQLYANGVWVNSQKNETDYIGEEICKNNTYVWLNNQWVFSSRNEAYYDDDAQAKLRREITGSWNNGVLQSFADNHYFYACDPHLYTIRFCNENGAVLETKQVMNGTMPVYDGAAPTKEPTAEFTYTFSGWDKTIAEASGDETYKAVFTPTKRTYVITFKNGEDVLQSTEIEYGSIPAYNGETPVKQGDAQYTYTFSGWDKDLVAVGGATTYIATFSTATNKYTITFKNGEDVLQSTEVEYGSIPAYNGETPVKQGDAQYSYVFSGWNVEPVAVSGAATYIATFSTATNKYVITFKNGEETLQSTEVEYGLIPAYNGETPVKQGDAQYSYVFTGWDAEPTAVSGAATYIATFSTATNKYTITFKNGEDVLQSTEVEYGLVPAYNGETPVKQGDVQYTYTFSGWDAELAAVSGAATYVATFSTTTNKYVITFKNGEDVLQSTEVEYGLVPAYNGETPVKQGDAEYTYTFAGWNKEITAVAGNETYTATFNTTKNSYIITWLNEDGSEIDHQTLEYGATPTHADPTKESTAEYTYGFAGWGKEITSVTGDETYTATFTATKRQYTITWLSDDGATIAQDNIAYGLTPAHADIDKESTPQYTFTFRGWSPEPTAVTGDAVYTAVFDSVINTYTVTFYFDDGETVLDRQTIPYGETPSTDMTPAKTGEEHYYYHFAGWSPEVTAVTGDATYIATFTAEPKQYTITFKDYNGRVLLSTNIAYGTMPTYTGESPTRARTAQYTYIFAGWSPELTEVAGDATYTAVYESVLNQYTVLFLNEDGTELDRQTVEYGSTPTYQGETPTKESDEQYRYTFAGWSPRIVAVTKDATYTATYTRHDIHEGIDNIPDGWDDARKVMIDGTLYIRRGSHLYTADGVLVE